jgi:biotin carboxyl carrier protein
VLPTLTAHFAASGLAELEVRRDGWRIRLRRADPAAPTIQAVAMSASGTGPVGGAPSTNGARPGAGLAVGPGRDGPPGSDSVGQATSPSAAGASSASAAGADPSAASPRAFSPAVGTFAPLADLVPGREVRSGEVLGFVDVLGVRQEVVAPVEGRIRRILAEAGEAVEYGQELVRLEAGPIDAPPTEALGAGEGSG